MHIAFLAALFFVVAVLYALAGFAGGSSYIALLIVAKTPYKLIPVLSLACNLVAGGVAWFTYARAGHFRWLLLLPFVLTSVPAAWIAGAWKIPKVGLLCILAPVLLISGILMIWAPKWRHSGTLGEAAAKGWLWGLPLGWLLGMLAGVTGIGGGIYLTPLLYFLGWASPKQIAALAAAFITLNSAAALTSHLWHYTQVGALLPYAWLPLAAGAGALVGAHFGAGKLPERWVRIAAASVILWAALRVAAELIARR